VTDVEIIPLEEKKKKKKKKKKKVKKKRWGTEVRREKKFRRPENIDALHVFCNTSRQHQRVDNRVHTFRRRVVMIPVSCIIIKNQPKLFTRRLFNF